jgi:hypothetical protein
VQVDTIRYDIGAVALMFGGVALMAINPWRSLLAAAGPAIFAMFARGKITRSSRSAGARAHVMRETANSGLRSR